MSGGRIAAGDWLKAVASQVIVLHHLAFYGPMADHAWPLAPALLGALADHGRYVVQVFLVLGGLLAARALAPDGRLRPGGARPRAMLGLPLGLLFGRYLRLVLPLAAVLVLAVAAAALARAGMEHPATPAPPGIGQVIAHLLLLQDLLGIEALSAGLWYVAIDFQLYAVLLVLLALAARIDRPGREPLAPWLMLAGVALSLLWINRWPAWDVGAAYFLGAYGLGALVAWWGRRPVRGALVALLVLGALVLEFRVRIALAAAVAAGLWALAAAGRLEGAPAPAVVAWLGRISYAVFLVHFPVCLVVNAAFERWVPHAPALQAVGVLCAWLASVAAGHAFHHAVERPAAAWLAARRSGLGA